MSIRATPGVTDQGLQLLSGFPSGTPITIMYHRYYSEANLPNVGGNYECRVDSGASFIGLRTLHNAYRIRSEINGATASINWETEADQWNVHAISAGTGTGSNNCQAFIINALRGTTVKTQNSAAIGTADGFFLVGDGAGFISMPDYYSNFIIWTTRLTQAEIETQATSRDPVVQLGSVWDHIPCVGVQGSEPTSSMGKSWNNSGAAPMVIDNAFEPPGLPPYVPPPSTVYRKKSPIIFLSPYPGAAVDPPQPPPTNAPPGYPNLIYSATPEPQDVTPEGFRARAGLGLRFAEGSGRATYSLADIGGKRAYVCTAIQGTTGAQHGLVISAWDQGGVNGGPRQAWFRWKCYFHPSVDYNPYLQDGNGDWTIRDGAGGCKFAGPWGGRLPATSNDIQNDGWALTQWTYQSGNYIGIGQDLHAPRGGGGYATPVSWRDPDDNSLWYISDGGQENRGRWVQFETETEIETSAGGNGRFAHYIDGKKGIDTIVTYMAAVDWTSQVGVKGFYLRHFYGGSGRAPQTQPLYYADFEIWEP